MPLPVLPVPRLALPPLGEAAAASGAPSPLRASSTSPPARRRSRGPPCAPRGAPPSCASSSNAPIAIPGRRSPSATPRSTPRKSWRSSSIPLATSPLEATGYPFETASKRESAFVHHLVQIQQRTRDHRPRRKFGRREGSVRLRLADGDEFLRRVGVAGVLGRRSRTADSNSACSFASARPVTRRNSQARRSASVLPSRIASSPRTREHSTYCGSLRSNSACIGVLVRSRRGVQDSLATRIVQESVEGENRLLGRHRIESVLDPPGADDVPAFRIFPNGLVVGLRVAHSLRHRGVLLLRAAELEECGRPPEPEGRVVRSPLDQIAAAP